MAELKVKIDAGDIPAYKQLTDEIDRLRAALHKIKRYTREEDPTQASRKAHYANRIATEALEPWKYETKTLQ